MPENVHARRSGSGGAGAEATITADAGDDHGGGAQVDPDAEADDEVEAHVFSQLSVVEDALESIGAGLLAPIPAVNLDGLRDVFHSLDPAPLVVRKDGDAGDAVLLSAAQRSLRTLAWLVDDLAERVGDCFELPVRTLEAQRALEALRPVSVFALAAQAELRDAVTIVGLPMRLFPIPGFDPGRDAGARPPTVRQLRLMADRAIEIGGYGTVTYAELAVHFGWRCPDGSDWPVPHPDAPVLSSRVLVDAHAVYVGERSAGDPDPGLMTWLSAVIGQPCESCGAPAGAQCVTSTGWRREAHRSHRGRLRNARRTLMLRKP